MKCPKCGREFEPCGLCRGQYNHQQCVSDDMCHDCEMGVKQLKINKEILFYDKFKGAMKLMNWEGEPWIFRKHPDGQWVSQRKATERDISAICRNARG